MTRRNPVFVIPFFFASLFLIFTINSCKKEFTGALIAGQNNSQKSIERLQKSFADSNYQVSLTKTFMDSIHLTWVPNWKKVTQRTGSDSISYFYIPLNGEIYTTKHAQVRQIETVSTEKYIIATLTSKNIIFKLATYTTNQKPTVKASSISNRLPEKYYANHSIPFNTFSGMLSVKDFKHSGTTNFYNYRNGLNIRKTTTRKSIKSNGIGVNAEVCTYYLTCYWINNFPMYCGNMEYGETYNQVNNVNSYDECYMPPNGYWTTPTGDSCRPDWTFGGSDIESDCYYVPDPPPPPPEDPTGGGGGDGNPPGNADLIRTDSLKSKYPCAVKLIVDSLLKLTQYNDFVQPFIGSQIANLDWDSSNLPWHVANGNGNFTYQLGSTETAGHQLSAQISLNSNMLTNSSRLFIAATSIHETLHAYLNYNIQSAYYDYQDSTVTAGSWLYGLDSWYSVHNLPSYYRDHYEMLDDYFDKAVDILAEWDNHSDTSLQTYRMAMLYGLDNANLPVTPQNQARITLLNTEYQSLLTKYGITAAALNTYWQTQLNAPVGNRLPTGGCN